MNKMNCYLSDDANNMLTNFKNGDWQLIDDVPTDEIATLKTEYPEEFKIAGQIGTYYTEAELAALEAALAAIKPRSPRAPERPAMLAPRALLTPRMALLAPAEEIAVENAVGRILAAPTVSCPPAVPILMSGEVIDGAAAVLFKKYGFTRVRVVKE